MLHVNKHKIQNNKITRKNKILLFADLHLWENYNDKILSNILVKTKNLKPDIICICGDIIDEFRFLNKAENRKCLMIFFNKLAIIAPTIITLGSHDYFNLKKLKTGNIAKKAIDYWQNMINENKNPNLILLKNQIFETPYLRIIGYTPSRDYFKNFEDEKILISEINHNFPLLPKDNKYTILMCHSPLRINNKTLSQINNYPNIDLILSGHMHDGLLFPLLKKLPTSIGLISPQRKLFPKNARGKNKFKIDNHVLNLIVNGGILKFSNCAPKILQRLNFLYHNDIDFIEIDK